MKNFHIILALVLFSPNSFAETWHRLQSITEAETIKIEGSLIVEYGSFHLCQFGSTTSGGYKECVDVIFGQRAWPEIPNLAIECVRIKGEFRAYSSEFVGMGWLVSDIGLLKGAEVKPCPGS